MRHSAELRRCLVDCDVATIKKLWRYIAPQLPQPCSDQAALRDIHYARTGMRSMPFKLRAYSHAWLINNRWPSALPDRLRPRAERVHPVVKAAVGISLNSNSSLMRPAVPIIRAAMENAVMDCYADGKIEDVPLVRDRMNDAKNSTIRKLFGRLK